MLQLNATERRVLGVLIEKGYTTPEQYPLSLNSLVAGCNQKSCRDPMTAYDEEQVLDALDSLRNKGLAVLTRAGGSRVDRFRHQAGETFSLESKELSVLAELLLRGPQTDGELRQRASRMRPFDDLDEVRALIDRLAEREEPFIRRLGPPGRRRGVRYAHTLYLPGEEPAEDDDDGPPGDESAAPRGSGGGVRSAGTVAALEARVAALEEEVAELRELIRTARPAQPSDVD